MMPYKCIVCGSNDVVNQGDVCELCAIAQDPYASTVTNPPAPQPAQPVSGEANPEQAYSPRTGSHRKVLVHGGAQASNTDPYGNDMASAAHASPVQVFSAGQTPQAPHNPGNAGGANQPVARSSNQPLTSGITKNITIDTAKKSFLVKWVRALFTGIPFTLDNDITLFQVFPDFSGSSLNSSGNACDQVIVYGKLNNGAVSENNDVEIYGRRDSNNNIIAKRIRNKASGTTIEPARAIGTGIVWLITLLALGLIAAMVLALGVEGLIWAGILILCFTNLPAVFKILSVVFGALFSILKRIFR